MRRTLSLLTLSIAAAALAGCGDSSALQVGVTYDEASQHIRVTLTRDLAKGEVLYARVRQGAIGELDCASQVASIAPISQNRIVGVSTPTFDGPSMDPSNFQSPYTTDWLLQPQPTDEMLAKIANGQFIIDVCLMKDAAVEVQNEFDARRALDRTGASGKGDGTEARIASTTAYAEACVGELGEIPFFPKLADGDYGTYNCLDSTPLPTTVTQADGSVQKPGTTVNVCDNPQYIYSLCEGNAVSGTSNGPRVTSAKNDKGTHWVLLCRKAQPTEGAYNDIAMIGHNPLSGKTCFFQNALYSRTDGLHVPHPGDKVQSQQSPQQSATLWEGIQGGIGSGIECANCHDADAWIHSPWIDQALKQDGTQVVPKMGVDPDYALGFNDAPYSIINLQGQGWTMPKQFVGPEVAACTRCHRIGTGQWAQAYLRRLNGTDDAWSRIVSPAYAAVFKHTFWMPPDADGLDASTFANSEYGKAITKIISCGHNPNVCMTQELPTQPIGGTEGQLPTIDLVGKDLATAGLAVLGANIQDPSCPDGQCASRRCTECHAVSKPALHRWLDLTKTAWQSCNLAKDSAQMSQAEALAAVNCMRETPSDASSVYAAAKMGVLDTGAQYGYFSRLFHTAFGEANWLAEYTRFTERVTMPKGDHPKLSQKEEAILLKWFQSGLANLDDLIQDAPPPSTCTDSLDTANLMQHISDMGFNGWGAVNKENNLRMFGCTDANPVNCFTSGQFADKSANWGAMNVGTIRQMTQLGFTSSFWTRSSPDGRFVANGGGSSAGATITDLANMKDIPVAADYDPGFFPDNSGFIFQGVTGGAGICAETLLDHTTSIKFNEPECITASNINLYQHVAKGLGGGDYFIINSQFVSDSGSTSQDPSAGFDATSTMKFTPMIFNGTVYEERPAVVVESPYEGDSVLSPSTQMVVSRLAGPAGKALGYVIRKVATTRSTDSYNIDISQQLGTVCMSGAKPNFSFDERFFVTHHYDTDHSNIILVDLLTGTRTQVTNMPAGSYAMYPHFRSDGWFYFQVREGGNEYIAASDAAIRAEAR